MNLLDILGWLFVAIYGNAVFLSDGTLGFLSDAGSEAYMPIGGGYVYFSLILSIIFAVATGYIIYLFFKRDKRFPRYFVFLLAAILVSPFLDFGIITHMIVPPDVEKIIVNISTNLGRAAGQLFLHLVIWSWYMEKSRRVKATFIN